MSRLQEEEVMYNRTNVQEENVQQEDKSMKDKVVEKLQGAREVIEQTFEQAKEKLGYGNSGECTRKDCTDKECQQHTFNHDNTFVNRSEDRIGSGIYSQDASLGEPTHEEEKSLKDKVVEKLHDAKEMIGEKFEQAKEKLGYGKSEECNRNRDDCSDKECRQHANWAQDRIGSGFPSDDNTFVDRNQDRIGSGIYSQDASLVTRTQDNWNQGRPGDTIEQTGDLLKGEQDRNLFQKAG